MCVLLKYIFFDFASDATLKDSANVLRFFTALHDGGEFRLADAEGPVTPETLAQAWNEALKRGPRNAWLRFENAARFSLTFGMYGADWRRWYAMVYDSAIGAPDKQANVRSLVDTCATIYRTLHPDYGYGLVALETQLLGAPGENELAALYDYNFLSPRLVEKVGRDKLHALPAWRIWDFDDGGLLVAMSPSPLIDKKAFSASYQQAAHILGMTRFYQGGA